MRPARVRFNRKRIEIKNILYSKDMTIRQGAIQIIRDTFLAPKSRQVLNIKIEINWNKTLLQVLLGNKADRQGGVD
jgi:hypothetical protein